MEHSDGPDPSRVLPVQQAAFRWQQIRSVEERSETGRYISVPSHGRAQRQAVEDALSPSVR